MDDNLWEVLPYVADFLGGLNRKGLEIRKYKTEDVKKLTPIEAYY